MHLKDHAEDLAKELAGNHRKFQSFGWSDRPEDDANWAIIYTSNRDSGLLDQSNAAAIAATLEVPEFADDVHSESHGHWAVGHVDGYAIRVRDAAGNITPAFLAYAELRCALESYPVLDDDDYSEREHEATMQNIENVGRHMVKDDAPARWVVDVYEWFGFHDQSAVENRDDQGGYPSEGQMTTALSALGYLAADFE